MNVKKRKIMEFVDDTNSIINGDIPKNDTNTSASNTTDRNVKMNAQDHGDSFMGRFGFYFYENDNSKSKNNEFLKLLHIIKDDIIEHFKKNEIKYLVTGLESYVEKFESELNNSLNEDVIEEDELIDNVDVREIYDKKDDNENLNLKNMVDLFSKLNKNDINKLINLLEKSMNHE